MGMVHSMTPFGTEMVVQANGQAELCSGTDITAVASPGPTEVKTEN